MNRKIVTVLLIVFIPYIVILGQYPPEIILTIEKQYPAIRDFAFSPDGHIFASSHQDNVIRLWHVSNGELLGKLTGHKHYIKSIAFSPDGCMLASGSIDSTVKIWDVKSHHLLITIKDHQDVIYTVAFSPDGKLLASSSRDGTVKFWGMPNGQPT